MAEEAKNLLQIKFPKVFEAELESVRNRILHNNEKRGEGLPDFETRLFPEGEKPSEAMKSVLDALQDEKENEAWKKWTEDKKTRGKPAHAGLVGLAFSGGGIRSATFNLGILQALRRCGLFNCIDYLSTVSGGGYIGSCLSSWFTSTNEFPFEHKQGEPESAAFRHLRNNANYLAPKGLIDLLRIPAMLIRGIVINLLIILPYILLAVLLTILIKPSPEAMAENLLLTTWPFSWLPGQNFLVAKLLLLIFLLGFILYPMGRMIAQKVNYLGVPQWQSRNFTGNVFAWCIAFIGVAAFVELQPQAVLLFGKFLNATKGLVGDLKDRWDFGDLMTGLMAVGTIFAALFSGKFSERLSGWGSRLGVYLVGILGFLFFWLVYLNLCRWTISIAKPDWLEIGARPQDWGVTLTRLNKVSPDWLAFLIQKFHQFLDAEILHSGHALDFYAAKALDLFIIIGVIVWVYTAVFVDVNFTSLHNFYRDRLSKAYLIRLDNGEIVHNDTQKLSNLNTDCSPYHLINAALNVRHLNEAYQRGRNADFFLFSRHYIGSEITGYCPTLKIEKIRPEVNLGTAMAISGAAAAPAMGKATIKPLMFLLAMLNVRLNYWLPNPRHIVADGFFTANSLTRPGPWYLLSELFGLLNAKSWNVNISDGGHIENLGIFELLRRDCRLIIAGDGECDPRLEFEGLSEVIRLAQVDLGIKIKMTGLDKIRTGEQQYATGTIHYKSGRTGQLIYLKSSLVGDDALYATLTDEEFITSDHRRDDRHYDPIAYIAHYKANNPTFPHETTGDQFFGEQQFECYRALGYLVGSRALTG